MVWMRILRASSLYTTLCDNLLILSRNAQGNQMTKFEWLLFGVEVPLMDQAQGVFNIY